MHKFKVGDKVIVVNSDDCYAITDDGSYGIVDSVGENSIRVRFSFVTGIDRNYFISPSTCYHIKAQHLDLHIIADSPLWKALE